MHMATELDAGDIIAQESTEIGPDETAEELYRRLSILGADLLVQAVSAIEAGLAQRTPQNGEEATLAPMLGKELSPMDWSRTAHALHCQVRGLLPWPVASTDKLTGENIKVYRTEETGDKTQAQPGTVLAAGKQGIDVACGEGTVLRITELQAPGKKRMKAADYLRGHPIAVQPQD